MNIIYIVDFPVNGNSGREKATREKANALSRNNSVESFLLISEQPRKGLIFKILGKLFFDINTALKILPKSNVIVVQRVLFLPVTRLVLFLKGTRVISEYHSDLREEIPLFNKPSYQKKLLFIASYFYNLNIKISHGIIYNHPYLKNKFDSVYHKPSIYSYNGSNYSDYFYMDQSIARNKLNISQDAVVFLFLGSVSQWHGVDYLINIFNEESIRLQPKFRLYIVGAKDNDYTADLKQKAENESIIFIPPVDMFTANEYINVCDFCMLPVKQLRTSPGSPLKLYDYIACGKPVIAQENLLGYSDEVEKYNLGFTLDFTNSKKGAEKIIEIAKGLNNEMKSRFIKNNRETALKKVSWEKRMEEWCKFLRRFY